jgi:hypothetical protein
VGLGVVAVVDGLLLKLCACMDACFLISSCLAVVGSVATHMFWSHERLCCWGWRRQ